MYLQYSLPDRSALFNLFYKTCIKSHEHVSLNLFRGYVADIDIPIFYLAHVKDNPLSFCVNKFYTWGANLKV